MQYDEFMAEVLACEPGAIPPEATPLKDLPGWDSLKHVRLVLSLEDAVGALAAEDIERIVTVGDVRHVLERRAA